MGRLKGTVEARPPLEKGGTAAGGRRGVVIGGDVDLSPVCEDFASPMVCDGLGSALAVRRGSVEAVFSAVGEGKVGCGSNCEGREGKTPTVVVGVSTGGVGAGYGDGGVGVEGSVMKGWSGRRGEERLGGEGVQEGVSDGVANGGAVSVSGAKEGAVSRVVSREDAVGSVGGRRFGGVESQDAVQGLGGVQEMIQDSVRVVVGGAVSVGSAREGAVGGLVGSVGVQGAVQGVAVGGAAAGGGFFVDRVKGGFREGMGCHCIMILWRMVGLGLNVVKIHLTLGL